MSITEKQYFEYIIAKDSLKSGLEHLTQKEESEDGEEETGMPSNVYDRLIEILARSKTGIPLDS